MSVTKFEFGIRIQYEYILGAIHHSEPQEVKSLYLAQNLKYLRESKNISQKTFADSLGVTSSAVSMWETNQRHPDIYIILAISEFFGVCIDDLVKKELRPPLPLCVLNIRFLRDKHEMKQRDLIELLGLKTESAYSKKENGSVPFSVSEIERLVDYFGVTLDQLVKQDLSNGGA